MREGSLRTGCILQIAHAPGAGGGTVANVQKRLGKQAKSAILPLPRADGSPDAQTVSQNAAETLGNKAKSAFRGTQRFTVPGPCVGDAPGKVCVPMRNPWKRRKTKGPAHYCR